MCTRLRHFSLFRDRWIHSTLWRPIPLRSNPILFSYLRLSLPSGLVLCKTRCRHTNCETISWAGYFHKEYISKNVIFLLYVDPEFWVAWHSWVSHLASHIKGRTQDVSARENDVEEDIWIYDNFHDLNFHSNTSDWSIGDDEMVGHVPRLEVSGKA